VFIIIASIYVMLLNPLNKRETIYIYKAQIIPEIDGIWEKGEWEDAKFYTYCFKENYTLANPESILMMTFGFKWIEKYLFFTAYVTDYLSSNGSFSIGIIIVEKGKPTVFRESQSKYPAITPMGHIKWFEVHSIGCTIAFYYGVDEPYEDEKIAAKEIPSNGWIIEAKLRLERFPYRSMFAKSTNINILYFQYSLGIRYAISNPTKPENFPEVVLETSVYQESFCECTHYHDVRFISGELYKHNISANNYAMRIYIDDAYPTYPQLYANNDIYNLRVYIKDMQHNNSSWMLLSQSYWEIIDGDSNSYLTSGDLLVIHNYTRFVNYKIRIKVYNYEGSISGMIVNNTV